MTPAARLQEAIEILDLILTNRQPADQILYSYFRQRRFIGSKDRRYLSDLVYETLRHYFTLMHQIQLNQPNARLLVLGQCLKTHEYTFSDLRRLLGHDKYGPELLSPIEEEGLLRLTDTSFTPHPQDRVAAWVYPYLLASFPQTLLAELDALDQIAPTDLRVNLLKGDRDQVLKELTKAKIPAQPTMWSPVGIRLARRQPLQNHKLWEMGVIEIQDEGSQLVALLVDAQPGMHVFDFCAGAGGKTLAIAAMMANKGKIVATDVVSWRLERSQERLRRSGVFNVECRPLSEENRKWLKRQENRYDRVLIDAPCSGTGTWRRNPDLKIRLGEQDFKEIIEKQRQILDQASKLVKPGGRLIYATCSLIRAENHDQVSRFLSDHPEFELIPIQEIWPHIINRTYPTHEEMLQLTPAQHQVDGFFIAVMRRLG
jgi:16S rRNA (cytosine967-C5)-methyltransferase